MFPKPKRVKNRAYRLWVAGHQCLCCGIEGHSQAAHPNGAGMGTKHSDLDVFPLCSTRPGHQGCHFMHDQCIDMSSQQRRELEAVYTATMQSIARAAGRPEFKDAA